MSEARGFLIEALKALGPKPGEGASQAAKKRHSERLSEKVARAIAAELRKRGLKETRPGAAGDAEASGAERRISGGIGAKKVDVTWATEESGLLLAVSIKSINFKDRSTGNFQKNFTNRRGDMLFETVTLHRRFPFAVIVGLFFLDREASEDASPQRRSTFHNAHDRFHQFTGRSDSGGRDEQLERLYIVLHDPKQATPEARIFLAGDPDHEVPIATVLDEIIELLADRNPDFYEAIGGTLRGLR